MPPAYPCSSLGLCWPRSVQPGGGSPVVLRPPALPYQHCGPSLSPVPETGSPRGRSWQDAHPRPRGLSPRVRMAVLSLGPHGSSLRPSVQVCVLIPSSCKDPSHMGSGPPQGPRVPSSTSVEAAAPDAAPSWGAGGQGSSMGTWGTQFIPATTSGGRVTVFTWGGPTVVRGVDPQAC